MENGNFPTSRDIYLEVNGRKLAVVEGYKAHSARESHYVEAFGSAEPGSAFLSFPALTW